MSALVVMGSGETAPAMVKQHRAILAEAGVPAAGPGVFLDTTFGFQANAEDLVAKTCQYFAESVGVGVDVATWPRRDRPVTEQETTLALLSRSRWVFAGPGSPSYALRQWRDTAVPGALLDVVSRGGTLVFGSAAACTVGSHALPVYEIYKVGEDPFLLPGLDLLGSLTGIGAVVIPHYDNAEGGRYDTRYCYLGEQRLRALEDGLPADVGVLGVDEHTALVIDVETGLATAGGNGRVVLRRRGHERILTGGQQITLTELGAVLRGDVAVPDEAGAGGPRTVPGSCPDGPAATVDGEPHAATSLAEETDRARADFDAAMSARDVAGCVAAVLALESAIAAWSTDTLQSDQTDRARRQLRSLVVRLGELAERGAAHPADVVRPFVDTLLDLRERARAARDFATADLVRDRMVAQGIEVRDTPDGPTWALRTGED